MEKTKKVSQEEIMSYIFQYFDDLEFIERINDLTFSRKVQLRARMKKS